MFGVEKDDWNAYLEHQSMRDELEESSANREAQLLYGRDNQFGIYQLNDTPQAQEVKFMNSDFHEMKGVAIMIWFILHLWRKVRALRIFLPTLI